MKRIYKALLRLYPADYRELFAAEMLSVFTEAAEARRKPPALVAFALTELIGLIGGAGAEWAAKFTTDPSVRARCLARDAKLAAPCGSPDRDSLPQEVIEAQQRVTLVISRMVYAIAHHDFPGARTYSHEERAERETLRLLREKYRLQSIECANRSFHESFKAPRMPTLASGICGVCSSGSVSANALGAVIISSPDPVSPRF